MTFFLLIALLFPPIEDKIPDHPFTYPGRSPREIITVDPKNAPVLRERATELQKNIEKMLIKKVVSFVREECFNPLQCNEETLWELIGKQESFPHIPLDTFLDAKIGVCRHFALTTTYLIEQLIRAGTLQGEVFLIRDNTPLGRHAWTLLLTETSAWHIDAYWNVLEDGKTDAGFLHLCQKYGNSVMQRQRRRFDG